MFSHLAPYLSFRGNATEAMNFYQSVLGGKLDLNTFGQFGAPEGVDPDQVMHAQLTTDAGWVLMGSDTPPGMDHTEGTRITVALFGDDGEVLRAAFAGLAEGGTITVPLEKQMWGDEYGAFTDKFGIDWMLNLGVSADS